jgi:hypothetical protein
MSFTVLFHPDAAQDIASLTSTMKERLKCPIVQKD